MECGSHKFQGQDIKFDRRLIKSFLVSNFRFFGYEALSDILPYGTYICGVQFGSVGVFKHEGIGLRRGFRGLNHIRTDHMDDFIAILPIRGRSAFSQKGAQVEFDPGSFAILSTSKPFAISIAAENSYSQFQQYMVRIPGPLLRARIPCIDKYCDTAIKIGVGAGNIFQSLCAMAMQEGRALSESQARIFGGTLIDAIDNVTREAPELLKVHPQSHQSRLARIREEAELYIASNLSNPALSPKLIAEQCNVSVSYLHEAFAAVSKKLGSLIRETRLEFCRAALQSSDLGERTVFEIALLWGFSDPAYFSRAYKARFGKTPREDRCIESTAKCRKANFLFSVGAGQTRNAA